MQVHKLVTKTNLYLTGSCLGTLGFHRGINQYDYDHIYNNRFKKNQVYTDKLFLGLFGSFIYMNPCFLPIIIHKEIYRLEINIRGLEEEKLTKYYNTILV